MVSGTPGAFLMANRSLARKDEAGEGAARLGFSRRLVGPAGMPGTGGRPILLPSLYGPLVAASCRFSFSRQGTGE